MVYDSIIYTVYTYTVWFTMYTMHQNDAVYVTYSMYDF